MLEFAILIIVLSLLSKIPAGYEYEETPAKKRNDYDNGTADIYAMKNSWDFKSVEDCMEFRELRATGWRGNAEDFYRWKQEV